MFGRTRSVLHSRSAIKYCMKYIHEGNKFIISKKLFENVQCTPKLCHNITIEPDRTLTSKLSAYHEILDVNKDGVVSVEDLRELTERFSKINDMTQEQSLMFSRMIENLWYKHWGCIDPFDYITVEKYLSYIQYVKRNKVLKHEAVQLLPYLFKAVDKDQSGHITQEEYDTFLECMGTSNKVNDLIKSLGIVNDKDNTIKLEDITFVIDKYLFENKKDS